MPSFSNDVDPISLSEALTVTDILDQSRFRLLFNDIPIIGFSDVLTLNVLNATVPGEGNEAFDITLGGHTRNFSGRRIFNTQMSINFAVDSQVSAVRVLKTWNEAVRGTKTNNSKGFLKDYSVTAALYVFDTTGAPAMIWDIYHFYPNNRDDIALSAENSGPMQQSCTFRLSYAECNIVESL